MSERESLLLAIVEQPNDDTPRLIFADWLDEQPTVYDPCPNCGGGRPGEWVYALESKRRCTKCKGNGTVSDTSDRERAAFIRYQIELAGMDAAGVGKGTSLFAKRYRELRRREQLLLAQMQARSCLNRKCYECGGVGFIDGAAKPWMHAYANQTCCVCETSGRFGTLLAFRSASSPTELVQRPKLFFARGFAQRLEVSLADFLTYAGEIFTDHPTLAEVRLWDKEPEEIELLAGDYNWTWFLSESPHSGPSHITNAMCHQDPKSWFATRAAALDWLSQACVKLGRELARRAKPVEAEQCH